MKDYTYVGPITSFQRGSTGAVTLVPNQVVSLPEADPYVIRLVERGLLTLVAADPIVET